MRTTRAKAAKPRSPSPPAEPAENVLDPGPRALRVEPLQADSIARRAYERFEARGRVHGYDLDDWYEAERELNDR